MVVIRFLECSGDASLASGRLGEGETRTGMSPDFFFYVVLMYCNRLFRLLYFYPSRGAVQWGSKTLPIAISRVERPRRHNKDTVQ